MGNEEFKRKLREASHVLAALLLSVSLTACLPESDVADDFGSAGGSNFSAVDGRAGAMATTVSQLALDVQGAVINSSAWSDASNSITIGSFAALSPAERTALGLDNIAGLNNGTMGAGYCDLDPDPNTENNALVTWFQNPNGGAFTVKGLGAQATSQITQALTGRLSPNMVGVSNGTFVSLAGPRSGGGSSVDLAACGLGIPSGVPVVFLENVRRDLSLDDKTMLVYETVTNACNNGQVGGVSESVEYRLSLSDNSKVATGNRTVISDTCSSQIANVGSNEFSQTGVSNISNALLSSASANGSTGGLGSILQDLDNMECSEMDRNLLSDEDLNNPAANTNAKISTCDIGASGGSVTLVQAIDGDVDKSAEVQMDTVQLLCGSANLPSASIFPASHDGMPGNASPTTGWTGPGVDMNRQSYEGDMDGSSNLMQRAAWRAGSVDCRRTEELRIPCSVAFLLNGPSFTLVRDDDVIMSRNHIINSWENAATFTMDKLESHEGWNFVAARCEWIETENFSSCPSGASVSVTGVMERKITAIDLSTVTEDPWTSVTALQCTQTTSTSLPCN